MSGKNSKKKKNRAFDIVIPVFLIGVIIFCLVNIINTYSGYKKAADIYSGLEMYVNTDEATIDTEAAYEMNDAGFPYMDIDFEGLSEVNPDFTGWLYFPALDISYPVVYGDENFTYLHEAMDGTKSNSGTIFIDCVSNRDLSDMYTVFYGHNMRNGSMFGSLKKVRNEEGLIDEDPYFYFYTPDKTYKCRVFAYYAEKAGSMTYTGPVNNSAYDEYIDYVLSKNEYENGPGNVDLTHRPHIMTLSTCAGFHSDNRTVIQAIVEDTFSAAEE